MMRVALLVLALLVAGTASAAPPTLQEIPIQGVVRDSVGVLVATGGVVVRIYADSLGGSPVYDSGAGFATAIDGGIFDIVAGREAPLLLDDERDYFMELDAAGAALHGATNRWRFYPGGGSHARPDLEARLDELEKAMGLAQIAPSAARMTPEAALAVGDSARFVMLGIGGVSAPNVSATLLLQPVGLRTANGIQAALGPAYLPVTAPVVGAEQRPQLDFALHPARPNPAQSNATFAFDLPNAAPVRLALYDVRGRCVRILLKEETSAGSHVVRWDGRDRAGRRIGAGVYQVRLDYEGRRRTGRLVMMP
jgi:hypothetical protein